MKSYGKLVWFGVLTWLVPFIVSLPFVRPDGSYAVPKELFKSIMLVVGSGAGTYLLVRFLNNTAEMRSGLMVSTWWLIINWILDLFVLVPLAGMSLDEYVMEIGLRYLVISVVGAGIDAVRRPTELGELAKHGPNSTVRG